MPRIQPASGSVEFHEPFSHQPIPNFDLIQGITIARRQAAFDHPPIFARQQPATLYFASMAGRFVRTGEPYTQDYFKRWIENAIEKFVPYREGDESQFDEDFGPWNPPAGCLNLQKKQIDPDRLRWVLWRLERLKGLTRLWLGVNRIGDDGMRHLAAADLGQLRTLTLGNNGISSDGIYWLSKSKHYNSLVTLTVSSNPIGDAGASVIAAAERWGKLKSLGLNSTGIGPKGATSLADPKATHLAELETLDLSGNRIGDAGAKAIAAAEQWNKLKSLGLNSNNIGEKGAIALASPKAMHLAKLESLDLGRNKICDAGTRALVSATFSGSLNALDLAGIEMTDDGLQVLSNALPMFKSLKTLQLCGNKIKDARLVISFLENLIAQGAVESVGLDGNWLAFDDAAPIAPKELWTMRDPRTIIDFVKRFEHSSQTFSLARAVMAGTSGSGKTHLSLRLENPDDPKLNQELGPEDRDTWGIHRRLVKVVPGHGNPKRLPPEIIVMTHDVGGQNEQIKSHFHLAYLAGEAIFILCVRMDSDLRGWPRYYLHLLADLGRRIWNAKNRKALRMDQLDDNNVDQEDKLRILVVPTHADSSKVGDITKSEAIRQDIIDICNDACVKRTANALVTSAVSCLDSQQVAVVQTRLQREIAALPNIKTSELKYVKPILDAVNDAFNKPVTPGKRWICSLSHEQLRKFYRIHEAGGDKVYHGYMVRTLLRTGYAITPMDRMLLTDEEAGRRNSLLLNPTFVNEFIYGRLLKGVGENTRGYLTPVELTAQMTPADEPEERAIIAMLEGYKVIFRYDCGDATHGWLVPDRFEFVSKQDYPPNPQADVLYVWNATSFVPEHALFALMARNKEFLEPVKKSGTMTVLVYAYRNACLFKKGKAEVQVYLNVLSRELYMYGKGDGSEEFIEKLFVDIDHEHYCGWAKKTPWRRRPDGIDAAIGAYQELIKTSSTESQQSKVRAAYATILHVLYDREEGLSATQLKNSCNRRQGTGLEDSYWAGLRGRLTKSDLRLVESSGGRMPVYLLTDLGRKFAEILKTDGHVNEAQMPDHDPTAGLICGDLEESFRYSSSGSTRKPDT